MFVAYELFYLNFTHLFVSFKNTKWSNTFYEVFFELNLAIKIDTYMKIYLEFCHFSNDHDPRFSLNLFVKKRRFFFPKIE